LSVQEIGDTTPIELEALIREWLKATDQENSRFGQVCATLVNLQRDSSKRPDPFTSSDFFRVLYQPEEIEPEEEEDPNTPDPAAVVVLNDWWFRLKVASKLDKVRKRNVRKRR